MGQLFTFDWEGLLGHNRPTGMMSIFGALAFHCHYETEGGVERPFLTYSAIELRVRKSGAFLYAFLECAAPTGASNFFWGKATHAP
jgi:hypothetical protein